MLAHLYFLKTTYWRTLVVSNSEFRVDRDASTLCESISLPNNKRRKKSYEDEEKKIIHLRWLEVPKIDPGVCFHPCANCWSRNEGSYFLQRKKKKMKEEERSKKRKRSQGSDTEERRARGKRRSKKEQRKERRDGKASSSLLFFFSFFFPSFVLLRFPFQLQERRRNLLAAASQLFPIRITRAGMLKVLSTRFHQDGSEISSKPKREAWVKKRKEE